ncbi:MULTISPECIES: alpha/beta fold hydrolase [Pseudomonas]|uniref:alpha/beta fold hydrolase n=1 Tax=Pseudomonas TaxID=286 RepID=UPI0027361263|nr:alpha/beta hydrolase [Pseudomonas sp. FP830]WLI46615.1 alpha/beta hydrolase [Pseudomonas sp. FP830]
MDKKLINTIAWSGRPPMSLKQHDTLPSTEPNSVVVDGATFTHAYVSVNGIRLHYLMGGDGKQPVLLVHGFPGSWRSWEPLMGALVHAGFTPIVPDYRGAGETDISVGGYDKKSMAHDLHELVTLLNIKQVDIIGHDMGLIIAYAYGALYPAETGRMVLMDGFIPGIPGWEVAYNGDAAAGITSKWHFRFFGKAALALIQGQEKTYLDMFFDDFVLARNAKVSHEVRQALVQDYSRPGRMEAAFKLYSAWVEQDANDNLEFSKNKLTAPLLTIGGDHSRGKTLAEQALHIATQPHSLILVDTGHWVLEEQTQATREAILAFFTITQ